MTIKPAITTAPTRSALGEADVMGYSPGSSVALQVAIRHPARTHG
ncbi:hypothetical protein [Dyella silvatica]|nr:hypothetical protein [Dyella silvatica]